MHLLPGRIYENVVTGRKIRIKSYTPGGREAYTVDAKTGKNPRWISIDNLHPTRLNAQKKRWQTGYVLEEQ